MKPLARTMLVSTALVMASALVALNVTGQLPPRNYTVQERLEQYGEPVQKRLQPAFTDAKVSYPPKRLLILGIKDEKEVEVYVRDGPKDSWKFLKSYDIKAASGTLGPKLREGDKQVPEGFYKAESLNPNSRFHLSIRVNYPSPEDRRIAKSENRTNLGGDIMIHGKAKSVGCLAMGDEAAEELFVLTALAGVSNTDIWISPTDFRKVSAVDLPTSPEWLMDRYRELAKELKKLPSGS
jgi:murein L,D-transpeptidase YafK